MGNKVLGAKSTAEDEYLANLHFVISDYSVCTEVCTDAFELVS